MTLCRVTFNLNSLIDQLPGENLDLHAQFINPQFAKVLKTIGFDKSYSRAEGPYLYDLEGHEYLDFLSGYGVFAIGRNHPKIKKIIKDFIDLDYPSLIQMEAPLLSGRLAEALVKKVKGIDLDTVYFTNSGTESIETAIKFARCATGRERILHLERSFHGLTTGSLALNGGTEFRKGFGELLPGNTKIPFNNLEELERELKKDDVAAFFFEPIQGKGVYIPDDNYLVEAQRLCQQYGVLFVADEVQTGLGRTGKWFAFEHWNLAPDIVLISKALSGGMIPVGAVLTKRWIYDKVFSRMDRCVVHSSTFGQNSLAMIAGLATLHILEEENIIQNAEKIGGLLLQQLTELVSKHEWIKAVRGKGLMIGIELGKPKSLMNKLKWNMVHQMDKGLFGEIIVMPLLSQHRILTQVSGHHQDIIKLLPPLNIEEKHVTQFVNALDAVLADCHKVSGPIWDLSRNMMQHSLGHL